MRPSGLLNNGLDPAGSTLRGLRCQTKGEDVSSKAPTWFLNATKADDRITLTMSQETNAITTNGTHWDRTSYPVRGVSPIIAARQLNKRQLI